MGTSEIWASDNSKYSFTDSTSLDPQKGNANILTHENIDIALSAVASPTSAATVLDEAPKTIERAPFPLILSSMIAALCNNASVVLDQETKDWKPIGDPTEVRSLEVLGQRVFNNSYTWN